MAVAGAAAGVARYPVVTATLRAQLTGRTEAIAWTWRTAPVGVWYQWPGGHNLLVVQYVVHVALPEPKTTVGIVGNLAFHYLAYGVLYGLTRQAVVARLLTTPPGVADLLRPVRQWVWDRVLLRGPRGAVFCACLRDVGWYFAQGLLGPCFTRLLAEARYRARLLGAGDSPHKRPRRALREPRLYDQAVGTFLTRIVVRAVLYPVDATIVRLMADEAGLTAHGYTGFFDCLRRSSAPLYSGFTRALVADLALGWAAAEAAHALSMLVWRLY
ncbi:hypothetical protein H4R21_000370 [Coemansia helicoidea]|uniref:Uncharacterized protein n=1 Tax=Coemansia helicoidea TaxID=1286919 RepID=A0ACC1LG11_9FUNG|nr:hypothetical protein H4R21_000370 [Coemansia helicoidea]